MKSMQILARDHARLPMQWNSTPYAGFTGNKDGAWMRTHDLYTEINVASQIKDPSSVLNFWKKMLNTRKEYRDLFIYGDFEAFQMDTEETFVFGKFFEEDRAIVALNFTDKEQVFQRPDVTGRWTLLVSNIDGISGTEEQLSPYEGRIYLVR
jgi:oligo-1,6-glucosidase